MIETIGCSMTRSLLPFLLVPLLLPAVCCSQTRTPLREGWFLHSACGLQADGSDISTPKFPVEGWISSKVPSTVLAAQVAAGIYPDPYFGDNLRKLPGVSGAVGAMMVNKPMPDDSPYRCGWWYRTEFTAPKAAKTGEHFRLHFAGINYRADIWLNGQKIAASTEVAGAYRAYEFDVTAAIHPGEKNILAVETFAQTEKDLGINWVDWNPTPPDRDMGLWGAVELLTGGAVTLRSPAAVTHFEDGSLSVADLTIYAELHNATDKTVKGDVSGTAAGVVFAKTVELKPHEERTVELTPQEFPQLRIHNPQLWWPRQMGSPHLEELKMRFSAGGEIEDEQSVRFGIREVTSELTAVGGSRLFRINGKPILIRGGGWSPDMLLREDDERMREQFQMVRDLNLNTIRLEGKLETDEFFRLADEEGILVLAGWCCCDRWERWKDWTADDLHIATESLRAQMLRLRAHPSLLVWLNGSDHAPAESVERAYLDVEAATHWPNPVIASAAETSTPGTGPTGVKMTGPYDYVEPSYWYVDHEHGGAFGFNTETSPGPAIPSLASRKGFLPDPEAWPPSSNWSLHYGSGVFTTMKALDKAMEAIYARPASAAEYERMAQTMHYDAERAMFEAYSRNKYVSTGVIQWMLNNAWPSMFWHLIDYSLDAGGGYYGVKKACEPIHIQYSYDDHSIVVVNSTYRREAALKASVEVRGIAWNELYRAQSVIDATPDSAQRVFTVPDALYKAAGELLFVTLELTDGTGRVQSRNFYWVPVTLTTFDWAKTRYTTTPALQYEDLSALTHLPPATVTANAEITGTRGGRQLRLHLTNISAALAFQLRASVRTPENGLVAPVLWSDNWIQLAPGESTTLTAELPKNAPRAPVVELDGWNVAPVTITPQAEATAR